MLKSAFDGDIFRARLQFGPFGVPRHALGHEKQRTELDLTYHVSVVTLFCLAAFVGMLGGCVSTRPPPWAVSPPLYGGDRLMVPSAVLPQPAATSWSALFLSHLPSIKRCALFAFRHLPAYPHVAAEAAGVPRHVLQRWLDLSTKRRDVHRPYRNFADQLRQAQAQARVKAEIAVLDADPKIWLRSGPGKEREGDPG